MQSSGSVAKLRERAKVRLAQVASRAAPTVALDYGDGGLRLVGEAARRRNAAAKEPFTVAWLERTLGRGDVLYDVGANVGGYSLIAAFATEASVVAFEPAYKNYAALCDNVVLNGLADRIVPLPVALGARTGLVSFRHRHLIVGGGQHDSRGAAPPEWSPAYVQPTLLVRLDDALRFFELPPPTHLKLDVDGAEADVVAGAEEALGSERLRSLMVELRSFDDPVVATLEATGFRVAARHQTPLVWYAELIRD